jgi:hypothetical protein
VQDSFFQTFVDQISKVENILSCVVIICLLLARDGTLKIVGDHFTFLSKFFEVRNVIASEHDGLDIIESVQGRSLDDLEKVSAMVSCVICLSLFFCMCLESGCLFIYIRVFF